MNENYRIAFVEAKKISDEVLAINKREKKYYRLKNCDTEVTERECLMAAGIQHFWHEFGNQESVRAARFILFKTIEAYILANPLDDKKTKRLLAAVRKAKVKDQETNYLRMFALIESFILVGVEEAFWRNKKPWEIIMMLKDDLEQKPRGNDGNERTDDREGNIDHDRQGTNDTECGDSGIASANTQFP